MANNIRETTNIWEKSFFLMKFIILIPMVLGGGNIINKVTLQFTLPKYSPQILPNTQQFIKKMKGTRNWVPRWDTDNLTPLLSRWHWTLMPKPTVTSVYLTHPTTVCAYFYWTKLQSNKYSIFGDFFNWCYTL